MAEEMKLHRPWMVAVWPGMGNVALSAGYYMMAKLGVYSLAEFEATDLFDSDHVLVKDGLITPMEKPRSRFFVWVDPKKTHDLVVFIGEAQPPVGKYPFCRKLIEYAQELGVERVFTFAAMGTQMHPEQPSRVFTAATSSEQLEQLKDMDLEVFEGGYIGGLNGVLLGVAAEYGLPGTCLLGEMSQLFSQLPFPKASLAVLEVFATISDLDLDFTELAEESHYMEQKLSELFTNVEEQIGEQLNPMSEEVQPEAPEEKRLSPEDERHIESLFEQAKGDRSKAYELKRELDRLQVFKEYEDRFLDLFKK